MSNLVIDNIKQRRSVRKYKDQRISKEELNIILEAGTYAPSALNQQSSLMVVIDNDEIYKETCLLTDKYFPSRKPYFYNSKDIIIVFGDSNCKCPIEDGSLVLQNLFLAATSLNIGSCWINYLRELFKTEEGMKLQEKMNIPNNYFVVGTCILGYPDEAPILKPRKADYIKVIK